MTAKEIAIALVVICLSLLSLYLTSSNEWIWSALWAGISHFVFGAWHGFEWPHAIFISLLVFVFLFRVEVKALLGRVEKIGPDGLGFGSPSLQAQNNSPSAVNRTTLDVVEERVRVSGEVVGSGSIETIDLPPLKTIYPATYNSKCSGITDLIPDTLSHDGVEKVRELVTIWRVNYTFEFLYSRIIGSQINLLKLLSQRTREPYETMVSMWEEYKELSKPRLDAMRTEDFLQFLIENNLILVSDGFVSIKDEGRDFLIWLTRNSLPEKVW